MNETRIKNCQFIKISFYIGSYFLLITFLCSCHLGPNFTRPAAPKISTYTTHKTTPHLIPGYGEPSQRLVSGKRIPVAWWQVFRSPSLNSVIVEALVNNPSIEAAKATLAQAQQQVRATQGAFLPQIDANASAQRERGPPLAYGLIAAFPNAKVPTYNLYSLGATVSFMADVFGLTYRRVEQQKALAESQAYQLAAAQLTVTGNIVSQALIIASTRLQIQATEALIQYDSRYLSLVRQSLLVGSVDRSSLLSAQNQLEKDRAKLASLKQQLAASEDALAILMGKAPAEWQSPDFELNEFTLPSHLPLVLPSKLVSKRPDIMAAEAQLHAACAAIGIAKAQFFPNFTLSGLISPTATQLSMLFNRNNIAWDIFAGVTTPIFHGGTLLAQKREAVAAFHASAAQYRQTVLESLRQVTDILRALGHDAELVKAERKILETTKNELKLQRRRLKAGSIGLLQLIGAERSYQEARISYARAQAQRYRDTAELFVAMGGGWNN